MRAVFADPLRDLKIGLPNILKQFGQLDANWRVLFEQQLLEHRLMDGHYLPEMQSVKIHDDVNSVSNLVLLVSSIFPGLPY